MFNPFLNRFHILKLFVIVTFDFIKINVYRPLYLGFIADNIYQMKRNIFGQKSGISVIVPVYDEIDLIRGSLVKLDSFMKRHFSNYEILVIESGSTDGTAEVVDQIAEKSGKIKVIHQKRRCGFGSALKMGYRKAAKTFIWTVTVDFPFPLNSILDVFSLTNKYDVILSYRASDPRGLVRRLQSYVFNGLSKKVLALPFKQINSAFKIFRTSAIKNIHFYSDDWLIEAEILYHVNKLHLKYIEIPVPLIDRTLGKSKITFLTSFKMFRNLFLLRMQLDG